jgi:hypothetical protein
VTYHSKGGIVKSEELTAARQRLDKHMSAATDKHATTEEMLVVVF